MKPFVTVRRLRIGVFICAVTSAVSARAGAADIGLIVHVSHAANLKDVVPLLDGTLVDAIPDSDAYLVRVHHLPNAPGLLKEHGVHSVEINRSIALHGFTRPGIFQSKASNPADWYKNQPAFQLIQAGAAAAYSTGRSIVVADINSQVDFSHPALIGHLTSGYDFVSNRRYDDGSLNQSSSGFLDQSSSGFLDQDTVNFLNQSSSGFLDDDMNQPAYSHGTMCAAIIAAISHDAMIMPIRAFDENGGSDVITLAKSIRYAVSHGATVINLSFGTDVDSSPFGTRFNQRWIQISSLTASAGNNNTTAPQFPAAIDGVITTASTDNSDVKSTFSNYGDSVVVDAPGVNIISAYPGGLYAMASGTSFSAPIVAGIAALLRSIKPNGNPSSIPAVSVNVDSKNPAYAGQLGYGRVNVLRAVHP